MDAKGSNAGELSDNDWSLILFLLFLDDMNAKDKAWAEFEYQLIYENRFYSSHAIIQELHRKKDAANFLLKAETVLYRARIFDRSQFMQLVSYYLQSTGVSKEEQKAQLNSIDDWEQYFALLPNVMRELNWVELESNAETARILTAYKKWKNLRYKGFDSKNSGAPPADSIRPGRANPDHIRYLYLSEDPYTPVYEVRPIIGQTISVARFKVKADLKIFDLTVQLYDKNKSPEYELPSLFNSVGRMFSKPYSGKPTEYIPTQYVAEEIKRMGFEGIRFRSSLNEGGINIVLFSDEKCRPFGSDLVTVNHISLDIEEPTIYHLFEK
ncbi:MAG: RES family NAD+ phosphorylase [Oscillospiraceae bacterium]|nr:RES family NAD+ phosphorylase [Oscillospiraceae bacterium]